MPFQKSAYSKGPKKCWKRGNKKKVLEKVLKKVPSQKSAYFKGPKSARKGGVNQKVTEKVLLKVPFQKMHILRAQKSARSEGVGSVEQTKLSRLYFISIGHWLCHNLWSDGSTTTICLNLNAQAIWLNAVYIHSHKITPNPILHRNNLHRSQFYATKEHAISCLYF